MRNIQQSAEKLQISNLSMEDIPNIDLYMDQVIQLFEKKLEGTKRNEQDKILTKTMINNYSKAKLLFPIKNKKYSKQHLILISLIYQLKGTLSMNDIKATLDGINNNIEETDFPLEGFYDVYLKLTEINKEAFRSDIIERSKEVSKESEQIETEESSYIEQVLLIASLVNVSNLYRRLAEKLVDELEEEE
ncbi:DUF1836 domain-containing protein [Radiobacillus sp. PE A8.2]|uniref:DUF1836 domain-containing protein n=1 Tax=Radiobacillus sp. PE A8.2 TaxID=3380349 RepID=UPI00388DF321